MNTKLAIECLKTQRQFVDDMTKEAFNMAIKALEAQAHIINCPDCKYAIRNQGKPWICGHPDNNAWRITDDFYCGRGE